jgi:excinuclease ABC subunit C
MSAVRAATDEQILAVQGVTKRHLSALRKVIPGPEAPPPAPPAQETQEAPGQDREEA